MRATATAYDWRMNHAGGTPARGRVRLERDVRRRQMTKAAREIFVREGYTALTLRAVAGSCDVRLSTVQHHFGDRSGLIDAVMEAVIDECVVTYGRYADAAELSSAERLRRTIATMVAGNEAEETALLFPELWALAQREPAAGRGLDRLYAYGRELLTTLILDCYPQASQGAAKRASQLVLALTDGLLVSSGARNGRSRSTQAEREDFVEAALGLVSAACGNTSPSAPLRRKASGRSRGGSVDG